MFPPAHGLHFVIAPTGRGKLVLLSLSCKSRSQETKEAEDSGAKFSLKLNYPCYIKYVELPLYFGPWMNVFVPYTNISLERETLQTNDVPNLSYWLNLASLFYLNCCSCSTQKVVFGDK